MVIKIELLESEPALTPIEYIRAMGYSPGAIACARIEGPFETAHASVDASDVPTFILLYVAHPVSMNLLSTYIASYFKNTRTKRIRIESEEILTIEKDRLTHIIRKKLEIDQ